MSQQNNKVVEITIDDLTTRIQAGAKLKELAKHYDIPVAQMKAIKDEAGLRIRSFKTNVKRAVLVKTNPNQTQLPFEDIATKSISEPSDSITQEGNLSLKEAFEESSSNVIVSNSL